MAGLKIRFSKKRDGEASITYTRADGTATGQRSRDEFFVYHDMGHFAVETTLGLKSAFLGLLIRGWDIGDFGTPWPKGRFPEEAASDLMLAEGLAGALDQNRLMGMYPSADELNEAMQMSYGGNPDCPVRALTDAEWETIVRLRDDLAARWRALPPGGDLELTFGDP